MNIDDARHEREAARVNLAACAFGWPAHFGNAAVANRHVSGYGRGAAPVVDGSSANQQIEHARTLSQSLLSPRQHRLSQSHHEYPRASVEYPFRHEDHEERQRTET